MKALVGYTGFVGSNLYAQGDFDAVYNSGNIQEAYGTRPDYLIYAGIRAEKYLANTEPDTDVLQIRAAEHNIEMINPRKMILISTIDVFKTPVRVDENSKIDTVGLQAYGYNRYLLECSVREMYPDALIVRLPGLYGENIKKNFIYDYINRIPFMLNPDKYMELSAMEGRIKEFYFKQENGFYKVQATDEQRPILRKIMERTGFSALNFTDSRSVFQFYNLRDLYSDIRVALSEGIKLWHAATEPISASELYFYLTGKEFCNILPGKPANYDFRTIHDELYHGKNGYIHDKHQVKDGIKKFIDDFG